MGIGRSVDVARASSKLWKLYRALFNVVRTHRFKSPGEGCDSKSEKEIQCCRTGALRDADKVSLTLFSKGEIDKAG